MLQIAAKYLLRKFFLWNNKENFYVIQEREILFSGYKLFCVSENFSEEKNRHRPRATAYSTQSSILNRASRYWYLEKNNEKLMSNLFYSPSIQQRAFSLVSRESIPTSLEIISEIQQASLESQF